MFEVRAGGVRYPDGGGLFARGRAQRETVRMSAAGMFEHKTRADQIPARLRVSTKSACQWRRRWHADGTAALASFGPGCAACRLDDA
jgi:hypothetical protein